MLAGLRMRGLRLRWDDRDDSGDAEEPYRCAVDDSVSAEATLLASEISEPSPIISDLMTQLSWGMGDTTERIPEDGLNRVISDTRGELPS